MDSQKSEKYVIAKWFNEQQDINKWMIQGFQMVQVQVKIGSLHIWNSLALLLKLHKQVARNRYLRAIDLLYDEKIK